MNSAFYAYANANADVETYNVPMGLPARRPPGH